MMMSSNKSTWMKPRHKFWHVFFKPVAAFITHFIYHCKTKKYKLKKGENVLVISNHQTDIDGFIVTTSFKPHLYTVTTDTFFSSKWGNLVHYFIAPIPKKKGVADMQCTMRMFDVMNHGGSLLLFLEGNRTYAEFQYYIAPTTAGLIKKSGLPLLIYNIRGGTGVHPRFAHKARRGKMSGEVVLRLDPYQYQNMSDEELMKIVKENLKVYDSDSGELFKNAAKAEYLERMFFICPKCGKLQTIESKGDEVYCTDCDFKLTYNEDLHFTSEDPNCFIHTLNDWYQYQKEYLRKAIFTAGQELVKDDNIRFYISNVGQKRQLISKGKMILTTDKLIFEGREFSVKDIMSATPISGTDFGFSTKEHTYLVKGHKKFNPLKYALLLNKVESGMKMNHLDHYFRIDD